jgi:hypothetical protein
MTNEVRDPFLSYHLEGVGGRIVQNVPSPGCCRFNIAVSQGYRISGTSIIWFGHGKRECLQYSTCFERVLQKELADGTIENIEK